MKRALVILGVVAILGLGAFFVRAAVTRLSAPAADVPTIAVKPAPFRRTVRAEGILKPRRATVVGAPGDGRRPFLIDWIAEDGAQVKKGDVLVRFDPSDATRVLADGKDDRAAADHRIAKEQGQIATSLSERARTALLTKEEMAKARELGKKDPRFFPKNEVIESEIDEDLYNERLKQTEAARTIEKRLARSRIDLLAVERKKADHNTEQATAALRSLEVRAPHDGTFVIQRNGPRIIQAGDRAFPGMRIGEVATNDRMDAEVFVLEADAGGLTAGKAAEVVLEARPDVVWKAKVKRVDPFPKPQRPEVPAQYFGTLVEIEGQTAGWKPGQRLHATIVLEELPQALAVPRQAVFQRESDMVVHRRTGAGAFEPVKVKLGPGTVGRLVITEGIRAGDVIALRDPSHSADEAIGEGARKGKAAAGGRGASAGSGAGALVDPAGGGRRR